VPELIVGGFLPFTTIDFPGRLAAVVFTQGCPWRCRYCQNGHLLPARAEGGLAWPEVVARIARRQGLLDGVVFSGGEPTLQPGLAAAVRTVRALGFEVGLHTAGAYPERLATVLPLVDWVGIDIKATRAGYPAVTRAGRQSGERAWESLRLVLASHLPYEVRTTVHPELIAPDALLALGQELADLGVTDYVLQACVAGRCLDPDLAPAPASPLLGAPLTTALAGLFPRFSVRRA
jgi:pyruvate formate lyase activating enzyme